MLYRAVRMTVDDEECNGWRLTRADARTGSPPHPEADFTRCHQSEHALIDAWVPGPVVGPKQLEGENTCQLKQSARSTTQRVEAHPTVIGGRAS